MVDAAPPARSRRLTDEAEAPPARDEQPYSTLTGRVLDGRYDVRRRLGEGGMSYVYQAEDTETHEQVAIKILLPRLARDPGSVERLRREADMARRFNHPNVCPIIRIGELKGGPLYLVMPFLPGEPLNEHETRRGAYPLDEGIETLAQICEGLQHAHDFGVVHRDLKPENVMLVPDAARPHQFRAVVMDFGLAKERRAGPQLTKLTQTGIVLGTPEFMSPEQIRGRPLDGRSDIYALGVLAYELFTGQIPFAGRSAQDTMLARLRGSPAPLRTTRPDLPARLEQVLLRALELQPEDRYRSMDEFAHALRGVTGGGVLSRFFGR